MFRTKRQIYCAANKPRCRDRNLRFAVLLWAAGAAVACQADPEPAEELRLARRVAQVLDDPSLISLAEPATAVAIAEPVTPAQEATPSADPAVAVTPTVPAPEAAPVQAVAAVAPAEIAKPVEAAKPPEVAKPADVAKQVDVAKPAEVAKADKKPKADGAASKHEKVEASPSLVTKPEKGDDVAIPAGADATDLYTSGKRKLEAGNYAEAIEDLKISQKMRYSVRTLTVLGRAYFDAGQLSQAEKSFKAAGSYDEAMLLLGQLYQQMGKSGQARKTYEKFLEIHGDHPKAEWVRKLLQAL